MSLVHTLLRNVESVAARETSVVQVQVADAQLGLGGCSGLRAAV